MGKYFIFDPYGDIEFFDTKDEFNAAINNFDFVGKYCEDYWSDEVYNVVAGQLPDGIVYDENSHDNEFDFYQEYATHIPTESILHELDENGRDENGEYWGDYCKISSYSFEEIK